MQRLWIVFIGINLIYIGLFLRLLYWQVIHGKTLRTQAIAQYGKTIPLPSKRGSILASDGSPLVLNQPSYLVYADPFLIDNPHYFSRQIASVLPHLSETAIRDRIADPQKRWVPIARKVSSETKRSLEELGLKGLGFEESFMRFYPEASMAAHLLGFVGQDQDGKPEGYFGIEGYYDRELSGKDGVLIEERDAKGAPILFGESERVEPEHGRTLVLWLDRSIQFILEQRLLEGIERYGAEKGIVIAMDPKTGGILGMASFPNYDPSRYEEFSQDMYKNPAVAMTYEPGSIFKPLIMAAALDEKKISKHTTYEETGPIAIGIYRIKTWDDRYRNTVSMTDVLKYSSNVGMVFVMRQMGGQRMLSYIHAYGFGEKTNIDLQEEASGFLRTEREWKEIDYATASFGQGIAVTPLQLVRAVGAIANEGKLMEPHVVKELRDARGNTQTVRPKEVRRVISKETAKTVTEMMVESVKYGEAKWAAPKGYNIAGKTGTAQIPVDGHYDKDRTIASFIGLAPADDPAFVLLVILHEPKTSQWGSETAAPLFFKIAKDLFRYLGIPPSR